MLRSLTAITASAALAGTLIVSAPAAHAVNPLPDQAFGMHVPTVSTGTTPGISFGSIRLWDSGVAWGKVQQTKNRFWWNGMNDSIAR